MIYMQSTLYRQIRPPRILRRHPPHSPYAQRRNSLCNAFLRRYLASFYPIVLLIFGLFYFHKKIKLFAYISTILSFPVQLENLLGQIYFIIG